VTSLKNYDIKLSTEKDCFIHNFISTLYDMVELKIVRLNPLRMTLCTQNKQKSVPVLIRDLNWFSANLGVVKEHN
jgi:hypothetical protein